MSPRLADFKVGDLVKYAPYSAPGGLGIVIGELIKHRKFDFLFSANPKVFMFSGHLKGRVATIVFLGWWKKLNV